MEEPFIRPWMIALADDHYDLDITQAKKVLGWEPKHQLREALPNERPGSTATVLWPNYFTLAGGFWLISSGFSFG